MANELALLTSGVLARDVRGTGRTISRIESNGLVRQTAVDVEADIVVHKIEVQTSALGAGLGAIGRVAQAVTAIEQLAPQASGRLTMLAEQHALTIADEVDRLHQRLRRL